jgi:hypothetical protein
VSSSRTTSLSWRGGFRNPVTRRVMLAERKLLVGPPMPDTSKGKVQTKRITWSSRLGVVRRANEPTPEKFTVTKPPEPMEEAKTHTGL